MRLTGFVIALTLGLPLAPLAAEAQPARKVSWIGVIFTAAPGDVEHLNKALSQGAR
jgi:hypothetical protein